MVQAIFFFDAELELLEEVIQGRERDRSVGRVLHSHGYDISVAVLIDLYVGSVVVGQRFSVLVQERFVDKAILCVDSAHGETVLAFFKGLVLQNLMDFNIGMPFCLIIILKDDRAHRVSFGSRDGVPVLVHNNNTRFQVIVSCVGNCHLRLILCLVEGHAIIREGSVRICVFGGDDFFHSVEEIPRDFAIICFIPSPVRLQQILQFIVNRRKVDCRESASTISIASRHNVILCISHCKLEVLNGQRHHVAGNWKTQIRIVRPRSSQDRLGIPGCEHLFACQGDRGFCVVIVHHRQIPAKFGKFHLPTARYPPGGAHDELILLVPVSSAILGSGSFKSTVFVACDFDNH